MKIFQTTFNSADGKRLLKVGWTTNGIMQVEPFKLEQAQYVPDHDAPYIGSVELRSDVRREKFFQGFVKGFMQHWDEQDPDAERYAVDVLMRMFTQ